MPPNADRPHVVLLHGLLRTRFSMSTLGLALRQRGARVENIGYMTVTQTIEGAAEKVYAEILRRGLADAQLSFVTHSLGSLVVRALASAYSQKLNLKRAVMLGPPNQGSQYAQLIAGIPGMRSFLGPAFRQIISNELPPASTELLDIGVIAGKAPNPFIPEPSDAIVALSETRLPGAKDWVLIGGLHSLMMYRPLIWNEVWGFLTEGRFSPGAERVPVEEYDGSSQK